MRRGVLEGGPVDGDSPKEGVDDAVLEMQGVALFVDAVEEEGVFVGQICAEEQPRQLLILERKVQYPLFLGFRC